MLAEKNRTVLFILGRAQIFCARARAQWQSCARAPRSRSEKNVALALALALRPKKKCAHFALEIFFLTFYRKRIFFNF
jgi:hypothetical protein